MGRCRTTLASQYTALNTYPGLAATPLKRGRCRTTLQSAFLRPAYKRAMGQQCCPTATKEH